MYPRVKVTGVVSPPNKVDVYPTRVDFANTLTGERFFAPVESGHYSVELPNRASFRVTLDWSLASGPRTGTSDIGILNLNADSNTYTYNISW